jgi:tetratricopeptide (TPR) repeat protein
VRPADPDFLRSFAVPTSRWLALALFALLALGSPGRLLAQSEEEQAKALFRQGVEASDAGRWAEAADAFSRSLELVERPSTLFNLITALHQQARYREALGRAERYLMVARAPEDAAKRAQVQKLIVEMKDAMGTLALRIEPASAQVVVDDLAVPPRSWSQVYLSPGRHEVTVTADGFAAHSEVLTVERHVRTQLIVKLKRPAAAAVPITVAPAATPEAPRAAPVQTPERMRIDLQMKLLTLRRDLERAREAHAAANRRKPLIFAGLGVAAVVAGTILIVNNDETRMDLIGGGVIGGGAIFLIIGGVSGIVRLGKRNKWSHRMEQIEQDIKVAEEQLDFAITLSPELSAASMRLRF